MKLLCAVLFCNIRFASWCHFLLYTINCLCAHQLLAYADDVNLLGGDVDTRSKKTDSVALSPQANYTDRSTDTCR
jgi:hypothetical protein